MGALLTLTLVPALFVQSLEDRVSTLTQAYASLQQRQKVRVCLCLWTGVLVRQPRALPCCVPPLCPWQAMDDREVALQREVAGMQLRQKALEDRERAIADEKASLQRVKQQVPQTVPTVILCCGVAVSSSEWRCAVTCALSWQLVEERDTAVSHEKSSLHQRQQSLDDREAALNQEKQVLLRQKQTLDDRDASAQLRQQVCRHWGADAVFASCVPAALVSCCVNGMLFARCWRTGKRRSHKHRRLCSGASRSVLAFPVVNFPKLLCLQACRAWRSAS